MGTKQISRYKEAQQAQKQAMLEKELETARELEEKNKRILQDEQKIKQYYNIFIALFGIIFILVAISFYFKQKAHRQIKTQALQLQEKNIELQEQREEILQKNEALHTQKEQIEVRAIWRTKKIKTKKQFKMSHQLCHTHTIYK